MENKDETVATPITNKQKDDKLPNKDKTNNTKNNKLLNKNKTNNKLPNKSNTNKQGNDELLNKQKNKELRRLIQCITNPKLLLCILIAWLITNGWAYILFGIGTYFKITWMITISTAYLTFLWLPISPEKILTFAIAIELLRLIFPNDIKTLAVLKLSYRKVKNKFKKTNKKTNRKAIIFNTIITFLFGFP